MVLLIIVNIKDYWQFYKYTTLCKLNMTFRENVAYLWGHPLQIFWSAKLPPNVLENSGSLPNAFNPSSKLSTKLLKNSRASCCSRKFIGSPHSLSEKRYSTILVNELSKSIIRNNLSEYTYMEWKNGRFDWLLNKNISQISNIIMTNLCLQ